ncbi:MAG: ClbS/DfsB family four-helix bundle protein [Chloroflexi bacterium]|nr:ClbS/DfsB family four-helix bundle protein [Chloroflexota bacterium]MBP8058511.1 ClbS/DfsB family four-helix bundle protein [Chloroflexota bacterium]
MNKLQDKMELVKQIETSWAELLAAASQLTPTQLTTPLDGDWTGKDLLAHITAWEKRVLELLQRGRNHPDGFHVEGVEDWDVDRVNLGYYEANRARPLTDIQHDFHHIHDQLMAELALWPDALDHPQWSAWIGGPPLWQIIPGDTYEHYEEHVDVMRGA